MLRQPRIGLVGFGINVAEEYGSSNFWFHMDASILEIGVASAFGDRAV
jgi:hypothetical protein